MSEEWSQEEIEYANTLIRKGAAPSDVSYKVNRKFKTTRTSKGVGEAIRRGTLAPRPPTKGRRIRVNMAGANQRRMAAGRDSTGNLIAFCLDKRKAAEVPEDPIADIGYSIFDVPDNGCRYAVARWPADYPKQRFCGEPAHWTIDRFGKAKPISWCRQHYGVVFGCDVPILEAAE